MKLRLARGEILSTRHAWMILLLATELAANSAAGAAVQPAAKSLATYANVRYGYTIEYPKDLLVPGEEADDGDGVVFSAKSSSGQVAVWGRYNANRDTPARILRDEEQSACADAPPSYEVSKRSLVAFSCRTRKDAIVYEQMIIRGDTLVAVQFSYPASEQTMWSPVVKQMAHSLNIE
ncbi:MAG TPA: hypothetical protein VL635_23160 [Trinickia sp.]|nr:hypothetical protein [Trinickia sp.]